MKHRQLTALELAIIAHREQKRKYTGEPYVRHPQRVAQILKVAGYHRNDTMLKAALLHDVVEDTPWTLVDIERHVGRRVAQLVAWLTDIATPWHGNRVVRKNLNNLHLELAPVEAKLVKQADMIDNGVDIIKNDPDFAKVYTKEWLALILNGIKTERNIMLDYSWHVINYYTEYDGQLTPTTFEEYARDNS